MQIETAKEYKTLAAPDLKLLNVMVVDDEPMVRETLELFFKNLGIDKVQAVDCGETALREIESNKFDYVFMDLMMPGLNGIETLKRIQEYNQLTNVIIMTGYPTMDTVINAMKNGASDFLVKPFRFQDIKIILERLQRFRLLMEKNWILHQELDKKRELEKLNNELEKRIRYQAIMYNIVDSLTRINKSEELYEYLVDKSVEFCDANRACFMIYENNNPDNLIVLAQNGIEKIMPGTKVTMRDNSNGGNGEKRQFIEILFGFSAEERISLKNKSHGNNFIITPFNIRNEPFGILIVADKSGDNYFEEEDEFILMFLAERTALNIENIALYDNLTQNLMASLLSLVSAIEAKDSYTREHSTRVTEYSIKIACELGCNNNDIQRLKSTGPIHDIGKIGIHDTILNKPDKLSTEEFEQIKKHPDIGVNIVAPLGLDHEEEAIIRNHHERWDGKGYPDGLSGHNIPRLSRILSVADAFDAMSSNRAYRDALPFLTCIQELKNNSGTQFDPEVVEAALSVFISP